MPWPRHGAGLSPHAWRWPAGAAGAGQERCSRHWPCWTGWIVTRRSHGCAGATTHARSRRLGSDGGSIADCEVVWATRPFPGLLVASLNTSSVIRSRPGDDPSLGCNPTHEHQQANPAGTHRQGSHFHDDHAHDRENVGRAAPPPWPSIRCQGWILLLSSSSKKSLDRTQAKEQDQVGRVVASPEQGEDGSCRAKRQEDDEGNALLACFQRQVEQVKPPSSSSSVGSPAQDAKMQTPQ